MDDEKVKALLKKSTLQGIGLVKQIREHYNPEESIVFKRTNLKQFSPTEQMKILDLMILQRKYEIKLEEIKTKIKEYEELLNKKKLLGVEQKQWVD
jgi:hypothetical protein